jgi:hypothetical protein
LHNCVGVKSRLHCYFVSRACLGNGLPDDLLIAAHTFVALVASEAFRAEVLRALTRVQSCKALPAFDRLRAAGHGAMFDLITETLDPGELAQILDGGARNGIRDLHDRMPVMLDRGALKSWLGGDDPAVGRDIVEEVGRARIAEDEQPAIQ